jgi:cytochrome oxidase Cu insertion factor (SCO1/SenC/PrrC family)
MLLACAAPALGARESDPRALSFVDQRGARFTLGALRGRPSLVTFVATRCSDTCPIATALFSRLRDRLRREHIDATLVELTLDPEYDTPFVMQRYARAYSDGAVADWRFASGAPADVHALMRSFGITAQRGVRGIPDVHSSFVYVLDDRARLTRTLPLSTNLVNEAVRVLRPAEVARVAPPPALQALVTRWSQVRDFSVTIDALETSGKRTQAQQLRYEYRMPHQALLEVLNGPERGSVVVWNVGDQKATAYRRGLALFKLRADPRDPRLTSMRGNGILTPNFAALLSCFVAHQSHVSEQRGLNVNNEPTKAIELNYAGFACPNDSTDDRKVTRDVLYVAQDTGLPVLRERFEGKMLVERWALRDLKLE